MLTRKIIIFCTLAVLLAEADLKSVNDGSLAISTDQKSTSEEAPTESTNSVSPDLINSEPQQYNGATVDASSTSAEAGQSPGLQVNVVTTVGTKCINEEQDENESPESEEVVKPIPVQRVSKPNILTQRKRSKPAMASKKRTRTIRP